MIYITIICVGFTQCFLYLLVAPIDREISSLSLTVIGLITKMQTITVLTRKKNKKSNFKKYYLFLLSIYYVIKLALFFITNYCVLRFGISIEANEFVRILYDFGLFEIFLIGGPVCICLFFYYCYNSLVCNSNDYNANYYKKLLTSGIMVLLAVAILDLIWDINVLVGLI